MLCIKNLKCSVGRFQLLVEQLTLLPGLVHLVGSNGSGKTTLLKSIAGMKEFTAEQLTLNKACLVTKQQEFNRRYCSFMTQRSDYNLDITLFDMLQFILVVESSELNTILKETKLVDGLGLTNLINRPLTTLSGGEQQRCHICRVLLFAEINRAQCKLILLDEPYTGLDVKYILWLNAYLRELPPSLCIMISHHEINYALSAQTPILAMKSGYIYAHFKSGEFVTPQNLCELFDINESQLTSTRNNICQINWI